MIGHHGALGTHNQSSVAATLCSMHIALAVDLSSVADRDLLAQSIEAITRVLDERPHLPLSFLLPPFAFDDLTADQEAVKALAQRAEFVRTAMGSPDPTVLPYPVLERIIQREVDGASRLGFVGDVLLTNRAWPLHLLPLLRRNGIQGLAVPRSSLHSPGVASYLDAVLPVTGWDRSAFDAPRDGLSLVVVDVPDVDKAIAALPVGCATTPSRYFSDHAVAGRAQVSMSEPSSDADLDLLRRKAIRLSTRVPERTADHVLDRLAAVASVLSNPPGDERRRETLSQAHADLISARRAIDESRRRGDDWAKATRLDWDADGTEDLHIELPELSLVLDLHDGGTILVLDDKQASRPLGTLIDGPIGHLVRHQPLDSEVVDTGHLAAERVEESRDRTSAGFTGAVAGGDITCDLTREDLRLHLVYRVNGVTRGRIGPEFALSLPETQLRVDGGEWRPLDEHPIAVEGHRFRLKGSDGRMVLFSALTPAEAFVRSTAGGVVVWLHWVSPGEGTYELDVDLDA